VLPNYLLQKKKRPKITFQKIIFGIILIAAIYVLLIATFDIFQHMPYFKLFLICVMGFAFLIISYILKKR
jgi:hypothetical protein